MRMSIKSLAFLSAALVSCHAALPGEEEDNEALNGSCGVERWAVKTGTDAAAAQVNMTAKDTTIAALRAAANPGATSNSARLPNSAEMQLWRLSNVTLTQYKLESDSDYHLVVADSSGATMIVEIPAPSCVASGPWKAAITAARAAFDQKFTVTPSFQAANVPVTVTGVGFFDLQHGQTGVAPNAIELHGVLSVCFPGSAVQGCAATADFGLAATPSSVSSGAGGSATSAISVTAQNGFAGSVALSTSGLPAGASSSFSAPSATPGQASTLTLAAGSAAAGTYVVTVTGTSGTLSHSASVSWTITGGGGGGGAIVNGGFESGLTGWTPAGTATAAGTAHGGSGAAQVGSTTTTTLSSVSQTFTVPGSGSTLSFWYQGVCNDTVTYAWATATLADVTAGTTATLLPKTCTKTGQWVKVTSGALTASHRMTLTLSNQGEVYRTNYGYTLYDDVQLSGGASTPDFSLSLSSAQVTSSGSASATDSVSIAPSGGFSSAVTLAVSGVPSGASGVFSPSSLTSGSATLTLAPGTAPAGSYALTVSASGGGLTHTAPLSWTLGSATGGGAIQTVFIILEENHNWSTISGSASAKYINNTLLVQGAHAEAYNNVPGIHPSLPNYLWLEAGTNFGILADGLPSQYHQTTTQHLVSLLQNAGISWRSYQESITGSTCPLTTAGGAGGYAPKHNPMVFFDDVTNGQNAASANCIAHVKPFTQLATDLQNNTAARYNFITPNLCNDGHNTSGCASSDAVKNTDDWLAANVPTILSSAAYKNGGALFITWDESESGDHPIGMIVLSPKAKPGYSNTTPYSHSSTLRTVEEIFGLSPLLGDAANATDLRDLFTSFP